MKMDTENREAEKPDKRPSKRSILFGTIVIVCLACLCLFLVAWDNNAGQDEGVKDLKKDSLASFTVNLADRRYLRTTITMEYNSRKLERELEFSKHRVKDAVLETLRDKKASEIDTPAGTNLLRQELLSAVNSRLTRGQISGLYFEEFIIQ